MVERSACSTAEETNSTSSVKSSAGITSVRNDGFVLLGTGDAENKRQTQGFQVILEPEVGTGLEPSRLDSNRGSASSGGSSATSRFSLFKWFKRGSRESTSSSDRRRRKRSARTSSPGEDDVEEPEISAASSTDSVDTFYSTATVRSFAFHSGTLRTGGGTTRNDRGPTSLDLLNHTQRKVGPFGAGAAKIVVKKESRRDEPSDVTRTLPANVLSRRRDITARYSLQPCTGFGSCGNFGGSQRGLSGSLRRLDDRGTARRVHVRGKRRAPNPPATARPKTALGTEEAKIFRGSGRKKRRPAPKPPERNSAILNVDITAVKEEEKVNVQPIENSAASGYDIDPQKIDQSKSDSDADIKNQKETNLSVNSSANSTHLVRTTDKVETVTEADKLTETGQSVVCKKNGGVTTNLPTETSPTTPDNEHCEASSLDLSQSISNDTLILHGGVLHWKKEANSTLTSKTSATNVSSGTSDKESTLRAPLARTAITTGSQTSAMPRPWYKRSVFEHSRDTGSSKRGDVLRNPVTLDPREEAVVNSNVTSSGTSSSPKTQHAEKSHEGGTLSRLNFFHRGEKNLEERRKENKRKSGLSILTNISELDKEAAAIVQEEQARTRAASMLLQASRIGDHERRNDQVNEEVVQDMVTSAMESSPRRGTRALISKFNAIGNITKVTVNSSFFSKNGYSRDQKEEKLEAGARNSKFSQNDDWRERSSKFQVSERSQNVRVEKDLSRYFLPQQSSPKTRTNAENEAKISTRESPKSSRAAADISARLSFLQGNAAKTNNPTSETSQEAQISRLNDEVIARNEKDANTRKETYEDSPKLSRLRVHGINSEVGKSSQSEVNDKKKGIKDDIGKSSEDNVTKKNVEVIQKEFSSIFNEIDKQFASKEFQRAPEFKNKLEKKQEAGTSSQVSKVLDILVEAEKGDRFKSNWTKPKETEILCGNSENSSKVVKTQKFGPTPSENPAKMDLKEMLKEMKHSLPKRPKPKKPSANREIPAESEVKRPEDVKTDTKVPLDDRKRNTSYLLNSVTVVYPPPIRIGPPMNISKTTNPATNEEREYESKKVSSAAQTCGNVRKVTRQIEPSSGSPKWKNEDVVYRTSGKGFATPGTSGLVKNTFQLIRPREFAQIEAIKTMKNCRGENTYANVIERESIYANALVPAPKKVPQGLPTGPKREEPKNVKEATKAPLVEERKRILDNKVSIAASEAIDEIQETRTAVDQQNMNTLAVNRLLRKLEAAIASGHHQQAAGLAKELARLKIHCSVVRQRTKAKDVINVNMYIEDKLAHQGPIPLRLARSMTVAQLKAKVFTEFEIPVNVQRWIVGKNLADDDATTLEELQAVEGSPVFLYLVAPELKIEEPSGKTEQAPVAEELQTKELNPEPMKEIAEVAATEEEVEEEEVEEEQEQAEAQIIKEEEEEEEEEGEEEECISEEVRQERYEALISLENCDVIPNSEPIECPICFVTYGPQEGVILRDCLHMFCRPCIANTIRYCEEAEVKCPFRDTEYTCESTLQEREIKALVEPEVYQQHLAKSIAQAENNAGNNAFHCKTPDCPGWCIYDDNVNNFLCPVCGVNNCLTCQVVHTGKNCRQYQQELRFSKETDQESKRTAAMLEEMVDRGEALPCPTCAVVLMKKWGCDWLRCSMCKTEICWVTRGPRWGPGGKGDTSGGCRCGENGVKCHPRCNYCH